MPIDKEKIKRMRTRRKSKESAVHGISDSEKAILLEKIKRDYLSEVPMEDIIDKYKISKATIYRWWRSLDDIHLSRLSGSSLFPINISDVIETINMIDIIPKESAIEGLIKFITWVRWPNEPEFHTLGVIRCLSSYVRQTTSARNLAELDKEWQQKLLPYLTIEILDAAFSPWAPFIPDYDIVTNGAARNDDLDLYATITHYLISDPIVYRNRTIRPTMRSTAQLLRGRAFGKRWTMSDRTLQSRWRNRAPSFPFLYVERFHSSLDWNINPQDSKFAADIDSFLESKAELRKYLGMVLWTQNRFLLQLDKRAQRGLDFAKFGDSILPISVDIPPLPETLQRAIQNL